jgi:hypothetical protein
MSVADSKYRLGWTHTFNSRNHGIAPARAASPPIGIVVDGMLIKYAKLQSIVTTHEGFEIWLKISDPSS